MQEEILEYKLTDSDKKSVENIKALELQYEETEKKQRALKTEIDYQKTRLNIQYYPLVLDCLNVGKDLYSLKTPIQVANCVALNFGIEASREMKNNIATTLSMLFRDSKIGRIDINGKNYYGLAQYFNADLETVKSKYQSYVEGRKKNP